MSFFSESIKEFEHVVWPTKKETVKYFNIVVSTIVILTIVLFVIGTIFSVGLFSLKQQIGSLRPTSATTSQKAPVNLNLDGLTVTGSSKSAK